MNNHLLEGTMDKLLELNDAELNACSELQNVFTYSVQLNVTGTQALMGLVSMADKRIICEPRFTHVGSFVDGIAPCAIGDKVGYVKEDASYLIIPTEEYVLAKEPIDDICLLKNRNGKWKMFSSLLEDFIPRDGEFDSVETIDRKWMDFGSVMFKVYIDDKPALYRKDGRELVPFGYRDFSFIARNVVLADKEGQYKSSIQLQTLINVENNIILLDNICRVTSMGHGFFYYCTEDGRCHMIKLVEGRCESFVEGYWSYKWITNSLVACVMNDKQGDTFDLFNVNSKTFKVKGVEAYNHLINEPDGNAQWTFQKEGLLGVMTEDGEVELKACAEGIEYFNGGYAKIKVNDFEGVYDLKMRDWAVLPHYEQVLESRISGIFRAARYISSSKWYGKSRLCWRYVKNDGTMLIKKEFLEAKAFSRGYAEVVTLEGVAGKLYRNGQFSEV